MSFGLEVAACLGGRVRIGTVRTPHGDIRAPTFISVGAKMSVRAALLRAMVDLDTQTLLANACHLYLQSGSDLVDEAGGLGHFINQPGSTFTDSGGLQVISLGTGFKKVLVMDTKELVGNDVITEGETRHAHVDGDGVTSFSRLNGNRLRFTPEISMTIQHQLGADIMLAFDELTILMSTRNYREVSAARTHRRAVRRLWTRVTLTEERVGRPCQALFGVIQGAQYGDLRRGATVDLATFEADGFQLDGPGFGGVLEKGSLGHIIGWIANELPEDRLRHLLGNSKPEDLSKVVTFGTDTFDCVNPSRVARNIVTYTVDGRYSVDTARSRRAFGPLETGCGCYTYTHYARTYPHHLFKAKEMPASTLATIHSERFTARLVDEIRAGPGSGEFGLFRNEFMGRYNAQKT